MVVTRGRSRAAVGHQPGAGLFSLLLDMAAIKRKRSCGRRPSDFMHFPEVKGKIVEVEVAGESFTIDRPEGADFVQPVGFQRVQ
jgi:hypothetical protein